MKSPVAVWAVKGTDRRRPLVTKAALFGESRSLIDDQSLRFEVVRCYHLGTIDLLDIGVQTGGVIYKVIDGKPILVTRGQVLTSGAHHILIYREETESGGGFNGEGQGGSVQTRLTDYLEVFTHG